jgi:glycine hydroxymethyltransferase
VLAHDGYPAPDEAGRVSEALALPVHTYDLMLIDLRNKNITGKKAQETLDRAHITLNKNSVPYDDKSPFVTSGIRIGVPAITTRGLNAGHMQTVVDMIDKVLMNADDEQIVSSVKEEVKSFMQQFPLYPELG